jgi:hypothetical protein
MVVTMKHALLFAGAAALGISVPAAAKPGHGNPHSHGYGNAVGYGVGGCPPGLAKKNNGCLPPGQAKKMFRIGQRYDLGYGTRYGFGQIPYSLRNQYDLDPRDRYYYDNGYLYQVDPRTLLVQQVISALLR